MRVDGAKFIYTQDEVDEYSSVWREIISDNPGLEAERVRIRDIALLEDEDAIIEHRSRYSNVFDDYSKKLTQLISIKRPSWDPNKLTDVLIYINNHNGLELEFDFHLAAKKAYERRLRNEI